MSKQATTLKTGQSTMQSPCTEINFEALATAASVLRIQEQPFRGHLNLRGALSDPAFCVVAERVLGAALPSVNNTFLETSDHTILWCGPEEWLILTAQQHSAAVESSLREALTGVFSSLTDVSGGNTLLEIRGTAAIDLLRKGCPLDLHPSVFSVGQCAQTILGKAAITLINDANPIGIGQGQSQQVFRLIVRRSFSDYLGLWLLDAAAEFAVSEGPI